MSDIVERLRTQTIGKLELMDKAADEIERLRKAHHCLVDKVERYYDLKAEIDRLRGHLAHREKEIARLEGIAVERGTEIERLRKTLKSIAEHDYAELTPEDFARATLEQKP